MQYIFVRYSLLINTFLLTSITYIAEGADRKVYVFAGFKFQRDNQHCYDQNHCFCFCMWETVPGQSACF